MWGCQFATVEEEARTNRVAIRFYAGGRSGSYRDQAGRGSVESRNPSSNTDFSSCYANSAADNTQANV
jgi:hypothetical protein